MDPHFRYLRRVIIALVVIVETFTTSTTAAQVYTRRRVLKTFTLEDWAMCFAWFGSVVYDVFGLLSLRFSPLFGNAPVPHNIQVAGQITWIIEVLYGPIIAATKVSILLQLTRIFAPIEGSWRRRALMAFLWLTVLWYIPTFLISIFECLPVASAWDSTIQGHCVDYSIYILIVGIFNLVSDCVMLLIPMAFIWRLRMSWNGRLGVTAVFLIGTFACITSVLRIIYSEVNLKNPKAYDSLIAVSLCTKGEIGAGILCGNLPNMPALYRHLRQKRTTSRAPVSQPVVSGQPQPENNGLSFEDIGSLLPRTNSQGVMLEEFDQRRLELKGSDLTQVECTPVQSSKSDASASSYPYV